VTKRGDDQEGPTCGLTFPLFRHPYLVTFISSLGCGQQLLRRRDRRIGERPQLFGCAVLFDLAGNQRAAAALRFQPLGHPGLE
jgi:hypothetical protein